MDKLITVKDVKERYGCSTPTARKYIRQCKPHMENPLTTFDWAFKEWEQSRIVTENLSKKQFDEMCKRVEQGRTLVPRRW
jgi:hypothetical protein